MELRGFDDYEVTLGDEMRGQRATLGKTLLDAQADLRIKVHVLRAIEDCDLDGFPNLSVVPGYVRSYARYLQMDPDDAYRRFCAESGYRSPAAALKAVPEGEGRPAGRAAALAGGLAGGLARGGGLGGSRFAPPRAPAHFGSRVSLGGLVSTFVLVALAAGLGYGGYALLQEVQRIGFAPLPDAPEIIAEAPLIAPPTVADDALPPPGAEAYAGGGALAAVTLAPPAPLTISGRDGPISAIDPSTSGLFAAPAAPAAAPISAPVAPPEAEGGADAVAAATPPLMDLPLPVLPTTAAEAATPEPVEVVTTDTAWLRVRDGEAILFEGILPPGGSFGLPPGSEHPVLRAGNAGAVYVRVGEGLYGPLGRPGQVVKNVPLAPDEVAALLPRAKVAAAGAEGGGEPIARASAD